MVVVGVRWCVSLRVVCGLWLFVVVDGLFAVAVVVFCFVFCSTVLLLFAVCVCCLLLFVVDVLCCCSSSLLVVGG